MGIVWDNETVFKLINLYQKQQLLWDSSIRAYKNKIKKNAAWEDLSNALDIPKKDVETKIHVLRSQFAREKKKISVWKMPGAGSLDDEESRWIFYDALKFLSSVTTPSGSSDTRNKTANKNDLSETEQSLTSSTPPLPPQSPLRVPSEECSQKTEKRRNSDNLSEIFEIVQTAKRKMHETKDEFDIYGQYVASELRCANNEIAVLQAKSLINNILIDMRMGKYNYGYAGETGHRHRATSMESKSTATQEIQQCDNIENIVFKCEPVPETISDIQ